MTKKKLKRSYMLKRVAPGSGFFIYNNRTYSGYPSRKRAKQYFKQWYKENEQRFSHTLKPLNSRWNIFTLEGITPHITLHMNLNYSEASLSFWEEPLRGTFKGLWDIYDIAYIYEHFDVHKGYYDDDRADHNYTYYPTQKELYVQEVFEPMLTYLNEEIISDNVLYLLDYSGGRAAVIDSKSNPKRGNVTVDENAVLKVIDL